MLQPFACGVELLLRTLPSKCIARVALLPERRTNIAKLVRPTLQCFRTICCTFHSTPSRRICRAATHRISKTNVHPCPCQARRIYTPHSARSTSCDLAAQGSSRCSSGNLIAARQANLAARLRLGGYAPVSAPARNKRFAGLLPDSKDIQRVEIAEKPVKCAFRGVRPPPDLRSPDS